jgi:hypothetical protein
MGLWVKCKVATHAGIFNIRVFREHRKAVAHEIGVPAHKNVGLRSVMSVAVYLRSSIIGDPPLGVAFRVLMQEYASCPHNMAVDIAGDP